MSECMTCGGLKTLYSVERGLEPCPDCVCSTCLDHGFITPNVKKGDPRFGQPEPCPKNCKAAQGIAAERQARLYVATRLPLEYQALTFDTFVERLDADPTLWNGKRLGFAAADLFSQALITGDGYFDIAEAAALAGVKANSDRRNWLVLWGKHGRGKTGLEAAIMNRVVPAGKPFLYTRAQDFIAAMQARYDEDWRDYPPKDAYDALSAAQIMGLVSQCPILGLDEFDMPDARRENKQAIIERLIRYRHGQLLPTLITTNLSADEMEERWGTTTMSVIRQRAHFVYVGGENLRAVPQELVEAE